MVTSRTNYASEAVSAAKCVLIEVMHILGDYRDEIILVGGWVPELLFVNSTIPHVGSTDVDILINHNEIDQSGYRTIKKLLIDRDYIQSKDQPFTFYRHVKIRKQKVIKVQVDFLAGEYQGTGKNRRTQVVQDIRPRKVRGGDFAFSCTKKLTVKGKLPSGANDQIILNVITLPAFIVMKGIALKDRIKEKDAWDIYYCLLQFNDQLEKFSNQFKHLLGNTIVRESLNNLREAFLTIDAIGPTMIADFEEVEGEERAFIKRDSFERMNRFLSFIEH